MDGQHVTYFVHMNVFIGLLRSEMFCAVIHGIKGEDTQSEIESLAYLQAKTSFPGMSDADILYQETR